MNFSKQFRIIVIFSIVLVELCSCQLRKLELPRVNGQKLSPQDSQNLIVRLKQTNAEVLTFRALSRSQLKTKDDKESLRHIFVFRKPDNLRIDFLAPSSGYTLALMSIDNEKLLFLDAAEKIAYSDIPSIGKIRLKIGIPATHNDLMSYLSARIPERFLDRAAEDYRIFHDIEQRKYYLIVGDYLFYAVIDQATLLTERVELRDQFNGRLLFTASSSNFKELNSISVPSNLQINLNEETLTLTLNFTSIALNKELDPSLFDIEIPDDYSVTKIPENLKDF